MRIPTWRLALTGGAIVVLLTVGVGFVAASWSPPGPASGAAAAAPTASGGPAAASGARAGARQRLVRILAGRPGSLASHFVDGRLTFTDKDGNLVTVQLDHGTIGAIGQGSITISEAGGGQVVVTTDASTVVRLGGGDGKGQLSDLKAGDQVFVQSRVDGATTLAKHVLRVPATGD